MRTGRLLFTFSVVLPFSAASLAQNTKPEAQQAADESKPAVVIAECWSRLESSLTGTKNTDTRIASLTALSLLGGDPHAEELVRNAMDDIDVDVHLAAIVAAGEMSKSKGSRGDLPGELRQQLSDSDPKVAFTAASTLWKMDDPSGEDILAAVAEGERSAEYSMLKSSEHSASRTLHSPAALAKIAAQQTMVLLVPPVGIGMGAYGYLKGTAGGISPQITAITQLEKEHTQPVKIALIAAAKTKDPGARMAAAEALSKFSGDDTEDALRGLFTDSKEGVRLTSSAAYIRVASGLSATRPAAPRATRRPAATQ